MASVRKSRLAAFWLFRWHLVDLAVLAPVVCCFVTVSLARELPTWGPRRTLPPSLDRATALLCRVLGIGGCRVDA